MLEDSLLPFLSFFLCIIPTRSQKIEIIKELILVGMTKKKEKRKGRLRHFLLHQYMTGPQFFISFSLNLGPVNID